MEPFRGWPPRGERLVAEVPHGHWKTITLVAALRHDRIEAPWLLDGPINAKAFTTFVEIVLTRHQECAVVVGSRDVHFIYRLMVHRVSFIVAELVADVDPFMIHLFAALTEKE